MYQLFNYYFYFRWCIIIATQTTIVKTSKTSKSLNYLGAHRKIVVLVGIYSYIDESKGIK